VTGGGRNIGREICLQFAREGANVVVNVRSNHQEGQAVIEEIAELGGGGQLVVGDVSAREDVQRMFEEVRSKWDRIDILVNNAAVRPQTHFLDITEEEWLWVLGVGLNGAFHWCKVVAPVMVRQRSGCIINVGGRDGFIGRKRRAHGVTVKAGLHGLTKALAHDLGEFGIRANTVVPFALRDTSRPPDWYPGWPDELHQLLPNIPLGRWSTVQDVARACVFLASDDASYITGQALHVNGGAHMF
jgi:NAD(P)-dependent dehydrogenase (short-subunit alcohol dehydrogenase family)